ncbi:MAG: sulfite exporter TauE/SafE family protein [Promethearchaeota archaeon]|jgi:uncharacterized membrane protein YfcA
MELSIYLIFLLIFLGLVSGTISVIAGIGGGVFYVSIMTLLFSITINVAVDTSAFIILFTSLVGFITYLRQKRTNLRISLIFAMFSILGSVISSIVFSFVHVENEIYKIIFAGTLLVAGINMIYKCYRNNKNKNIHEEENFNLEEHDYQSNLKKAIPYFILAGFVSNFLGIGGGIINSPSLHIILQFPIHNSTAISTSMVFFTAIYNTIIQSIIGQIEVVIGIFIAIGTILGAILGAKISNIMPKVYLQYSVAIILICLAIYMFF